MSSLDDHSLIRGNGYAISASPKPILYSFAQRTYGRYVYEAGTASGVTDSVTTMALNHYNYQDANPIVFAKMQTTEGRDPSTERVYDVTKDNFKLYIQEEKSHDTELEHAAEDVAYMVFKEGLIRDRDMQIIGEVGTVSIGKSKLGGISIMKENLLGGSYKNPVVLLNLSTRENESYLAFTKLRKVYSNRFKYEVQDWKYKSLNLMSRTSMSGEKASYLIVEAGAHILSTGELLQATKVSGV
eukprot:CAMPEP_0118707424 /NCGR_PEP_ID=MMETSP0800-20121206/21203_1 /TAXON_ID=210618 ORGANISM="Striatella unipunctata, Strain CCMP2910" /NCGR_SAMPLE_ID=MMETSP0800 /ASSEMBLY_ACC=CAM_ASM_000638 /LENGTH=241 /DNA_ID=CAMNT_0006610263 /DNA_START=83 /DNA_END=805 /DNA_ORIENTATION=-